MKVKCVDSSQYEKYLTKGKIYEVLKEEDNAFVIKGNDGFNYGYYKARFVIVEEERTYYADEILKMWREGELKAIDILIGNKNNEVSIMFALGNSLERFVKYQPYKIKEIKYMTFLEAKEKGIPKNKDYEYEITINRKDGMIAFIQDLDKKVWTIEGEE